ncbi:MAG TPA: SRPBCC family protein, partial [Armatimonadota bacterium]
VYQAARDIRRWPAILPHYRWVKILGEQAEGTLVEMAAKRGWIPVCWTAVQWCEADQRHIHYRHTGGATQGMQVVWEIAPSAAGTRVMLIHDLTLDTPIVRSWIGKMIVGHFFVHHIACRTLNVMKQLLEKENACVEQSSPASDR